MGTNMMNEDGYSFLDPFEVMKYRVGHTMNPLVEEQKTKQIKRFSPLQVEYYASVICRPQFIGIGHLNVSFSVAAYQSLIALKAKKCNKEDATTFMSSNVVLLSYQILTKPALSAGISFPSYPDHRTVISIEFEGDCLFREAFCILD